MKLYLEQSERQQGVQKSRKVRRSQSWAKAKENLVLVTVNNPLRSSVIISYFGFCRLLKKTWLHMMRYIRKYISKLHVVIVFMGAELSVVVNRIKSSIMQPFPVSVVIHRQLSASFLLKHPSCRFCLCRRSRDYCSTPSDTSILPPLSQHPHRLNQAQLSECACQH